MEGNSWRIEWFNAPLGWGDESSNLSLTSLL